MSLGCLALCSLLSVWWLGGVGAEGWAWTRLCFLWGIACFSSMDIAGCGRRNKQTFSVFLPSSPLFFRDGPVHRGGSVTDVCLCYASIYLFGKQMHY